MKTLLKFLVRKCEIYSWASFTLALKRRPSHSTAKWCWAGVDRANHSARTRLPDSAPCWSPLAAAPSVWPHTAGGASPPSPEFSTRRPGTARVPRDRRVIHAGLASPSRPPRGLAFPAEPRRGPWCPGWPAGLRAWHGCPLGTVSDTLSVQWQSSPDLLASLHPSNSKTTF